MADLVKDKAVVFADKSVFPSDCMIWTEILLQKQSPQAASTSDGEHHKEHRAFCPSGGNRLAN